MIRSGRKTVTTAGAAERLAATTPADWLMIQAESDNTGNVCIGGSNVVAATGSRVGVFVEESVAFGTPVFIPGPLDLTDVHVDVTVNGDGVHFIYMERS